MEASVRYHAKNQQFATSYQIERKFDNLPKLPEITVEFEYYLREW